MTLSQLIGVCCLVTGFCGALYLLLDPDRNAQDIDLPERPSPPGHHQ